MFPRLTPGSYSGTLSPRAPSPGNIPVSGSPCASTGEFLRYTATWVETGWGQVIYLQPPLTQGEVEQLRRYLDDAQSLYRRAFEAYSQSFDSPAAADLLRAVQAALKELEDLTPPGTAIDQARAAALRAACGELYALLDPLEPEELMLDRDLRHRALSLLAQIDCECQAIRNVLEKKGY